MFYFLLDLHASKVLEAVISISEGHDSDDLHVQGPAAGIVVTGSDLGEVLNTILIEEPTDTTYLHEIFVKCTFSNCKSNGSLWSNLLID